MGDDKGLDLDQLLGTLSGALAEPEGKPGPELNLVTRPEMYIPDTIEVYHGETYWTIFCEYHSGFCGNPSQLGAGTSVSSGAR
ncbi:hypothetical protein MAE02_59750 [Microvirga aerophila]|uniref:Uncharacterized protein n=1 Tax=Microvirga aerophila TaxID=670291 RepID=A0A512C272_9HYPH|nr:hypothetical protein MAE02_59750 [Microvirga aerophila]